MWRGGEIGDEPGAGNWGSVFKWPLIGIHTILTPDNKILTFGTDLQGKQSGLLYYDVWDPKTNAHFTLDNVTEVDMFCAVAMVIPATGKIMIAGGDARPVGDVNFGVTSVNHFDYRDKSLVKAPDGEMAYPRWYPTAVTLANGTILVIGGKGGPHHGGDGRLAVSRSSIRPASAGRRWRAPPTRRSRRTGSIRAPG